MASQTGNKKIEELKHIISTLEQKIRQEESDPGTKVNSSSIMDRVTYLKRKLLIFKELLLKYSSESI